MQKPEVAEAAEQEVAALREQRVEEEEEQLNEFLAG